jgi:hypothetical protein
MMHNLSRGIWTCAALYVVIGLIGVFFLVTQPGVATSSEGYGVATFAAPATLR